MDAYPTLRRTAALAFRQSFLLRFVTIGIPRPWFSRTGVRSIVITAKCFLPLVVAIVIQFLVPAMGFKSYVPYLYIAGCCLVCTLAISAAWSTWSFVFTLAIPLQQLVAPDPTGACRAASILLRRLSVPRQAFFTMAGITTGDLFLALVSSSVNKHLEIKAASYITVALVSAVGANGLFMLKNGLEFSGRILLADTPKSLVWYSPAHTPVLRRVTSLSWVVTTYAVGVTGLTEFLASLVPARQSSTGLEVLLIGFPVLSVASFLAVLALGHVVISSVIRRGKEQAINTISTMVGPIHELRDTDKLANAKELLDIQATVADSPSLPYSFTAYVPLIAALVAPLTAYLLSRGR